MIAICPLWLAVVVSFLTWAPPGDGIVREFAESDRTKNFKMGTRIAIGASTRTSLDKGSAHTGTKAHLSWRNEMAEEKKAKSAGKKSKGSKASAKGSAKSSGKAKKGPKVSDK